MKKKQSKKYNVVVGIPSYNEHLDFTDKAVANINKVINGDYQISGEILEYLKQWLLNHIQGTDKKYIDCFKKNGLK